METNSKIVNNHSPLVSILMLTYNRAHFISEAISSVINQTYQNWELFVIDDGSTDNTESVISNFADTRIKYIKHETNAGLFVRRKESLTYPNSKYVAILDSDDIWLNSNKLAEQVAFLEINKSHVLVGTMTTIVNEEGNKIGQSSFALHDLDIRKRILIRNQFTHSSLLINRETLTKTVGYLPTLAEDLELILQLGNFGLLANLPGYYTAHRVHDNSENDHGIKMSSALKEIIANHANSYPNANLAKIANYLRVLRSYLK